MRKNNITNDTRLIITTGKIVSNELNVHRQSYFDENSLFIRGVSQRIEYSEPQEIDDTDDLPEPVLNPEDMINHEFAPKSIIQNMEVMMHGKDEFKLSDWKLNNSNELIKAILSTIRGHDSNVFFKAEVDKEKHIQNGIFYLIYFTVGIKIMNNKSYQKGRQLVQNRKICK